MREAVGSPPVSPFLRDYDTVKPFTISCTTCQTRLKVRNEQAVGQLLSCPKCGSMVHVAPAAIAGLSPDGADSTSAVNSVLPSATNATSVASADDLLGSTFDEIDGLLSDDPPVQQPNEPVTTSPPRTGRGRGPQ